MSLLDRIKDAKVITQEEIDAMSPKERREMHLCRHDPESHGVCKRSDCEICTSTHSSGIAHRLFDTGIINYYSEECVAHELEMVRKEEREACAQLVRDFEEGERDSFAIDRDNEICNAIRARGDKE